MKGSATAFDHPGWVPQTIPRMAVIDFSFLLSGGPMVWVLVAIGLIGITLTVERTLYLLDQVDHTARLYFQGLIKLTVLDTVCLALGLWVLGVSAPLLLGLLRRDGMEQIQGWKKKSEIGRIVIHRDL